MDYLRGLLTLESLVVLCLVPNFLLCIVNDSMYTCRMKAINYIYVLSIFHASRQPPDVLREDLWERQVISFDNTPFCEKMTRIVPSNEINLILL